MDLRIFRPTDNPDFNFKTFDRINSRTGNFSCRWLEFIGWYTSSVRLRLLGHYRLFQLYKKQRLKSPAHLSPIQGYILQYRATHWMKRYSYILISRLPSLFGPPDDHVEIHAINNLLIHQRADILYQFLDAADTNFEEAFKIALLRINAPEFINTSPAPTTHNSSVIYNLQQHNTITDAHNEFNIHPTVEKETSVREVIIKEPASKELRGKEKGVFSKRQTLILLDLLAREGKIDPLPIDKPAKTESVARFLMALTGKSIDAWLETLQNYRGKDLYEYHTDAERKNLLSTLETLATITRNAGLRKIAGLVDKKIIELQRQP
ncbi:MAG: hypothetical protein JST42_10490 [Bacteroidetes bacterium]|nr:hypothetical protein [Bacteroidota bacterium]